MSLLRGRRYERTKKAQHRPEKGAQSDPLIGKTADRSASGQNDHLKTAERLAKEHGVSGDMKGRRRHAPKLAQWAEARIKMIHACLPLNGWQKSMA